MLGLQQALRKEKGTDWIDGRKGFTGAVCLWLKKLIN